MLEAQTSRSAQPEVQTSSAQPEPARPTRIIHDVQVLIATQGTARDLAKHHIVSRSWHAAARREISLRLAGRGDASAALRGVEILEERVGPRPARGWRDTWAELNYAKYLRIDPSVVPVREALLAHWRGRPLHGELAQVRASIDWKVQHGWSRTLAEAYTLIMTHFKGALGDSIREASREFSAAIHLLRDACSLRAPLEAVAPDAYTDLDGTYGMKTNDPVWGALVPGAAPGVSFITHAPLEASAHARCLSDAGFAAAVVIGTGIDYAPMDSDIVRFRSRARAGGKHRSLVRTAETSSERQFDLPPLSRVTLQSIEEAGSWTEFGVTPNRRLYTVVGDFLA